MSESLANIVVHLVSGTTNRLNEQFGYAYDAAGNLNFRTNDTLVQTFNVNSLNALTTVTRTTNQTVAGSTFGPATSVTVNGATATRYADSTFAKANIALVNGSNTFTAIAQDSLGRLDTNIVSVYLPATNSFLYDRNGNLRTNGTRIFEYDDENQLTRITEPNAWKAEFTYDGKLRRRIEKNYRWTGAAWLQTNEFRFVYDGNLAIQDRNELNLPTLSLTRGLDLSSSLQGAGGIGGLLALTDNAALNPQSSTAHSYYHTDGNGNVTMLLDANESIAARYLYDPFGNTLSASGPKAGANRFRFSSKSIHEPSGMYDYLYRWYLPELQRWPNWDPIGERGGFNLHGFVRNNPISIVDRFGLEIGRFTTLFGPQPPNPPESLVDLTQDCAARIANELGENSPFGTRDPSSRWNHCVASCRIARECPGGAFTAWIAGDWYQDPWWRTPDDNSDPDDRAANQVGRDACKKKKSCEESCNDAFNNGSLYPAPPSPPPLPPFLPLGF